MTCDLRDGGEVREGAAHGGGQELTPRVSFLFMEGHAGRSTATVLQEEVLGDRQEEKVQDVSRRHMKCVLQYPNLV